MKRILLLLLAVAFMTGAAKNPRQAYIDRYGPLAVQEMQRTGVPASITLAQALLESGAGLSPLAEKANNHFGLKCHADWSGEKFYKNDDRADECFRVFPSVEDSYRAHSDFLLGRERYRSLFDLDPTDYKGWARGLRRAGYATDPGYANKLITLIEDFQLYRFDTMEPEDFPVELPEPAAKREVEPIVSVPVSVVPEETARTPQAEERSLPDRNAPPVETVSLSLTRPIYTLNGIRCVRTVEGESWASLASEFRLSERQLLRLNDLDAPLPLQPGTVVYLDRKKAQADYGKYEVEQDDMTLWDISQMFGIQLKKLRLYNAFRGGAPLKSGDTVLLRKP